jgi:hypothetical protein
MLAKSFRPSFRSSRQRATVLALLLALACSEPALAACGSGGWSGWWSWLGVPGFGNW